MPEDRVFECTFKGVTKEYWGHTYDPQTGRCRNNECNARQSIEHPIPSEEPDGPCPGNPVTVYPGDTIVHHARHILLSHIEALDKRAEAAEKELATLKEQTNPMLAAIASLAECAKGIEQRRQAIEDAQKVSPETMQCEIC